MIADYEAIAMMAAKGALKDELDKGRGAGGE